MNYSEGIRDILAPFFSKRPEVKVAYLFGSVSQGQGNALSDIDIAVLVDPSVLSETYQGIYPAELTAELIKVLKTNQVEVVILNEAPVLLRSRVLVHGKVLFSRAETERIEFQVRTVNEYNDFRKALDVQHRYMLKRIENGSFGHVPHVHR